MGAHAVIGGQVSIHVRERIRELRIAKKWSMVMLSDRIKATGGKHYDKSQLSWIETGHRRIDVDDLAAIATALGVEPIELLP